MPEPRLAEGLHVILNVILISFQLDTQNEDNPPVRYFSAFKFMNQI